MAESHKERPDGRITGELPHKVAVVHPDPPPAEDTDEEPPRGRQARESEVQAANERHQDGNPPQSEEKRGDDAHNSPK